MQAQNGGSSPMFCFFLLRLYLFILFRFYFFFVVYGFVFFVYLFLLFSWSLCCGAYNCSTYCEDQTVV